MNTPRKIDIFHVHKKTLIKQTNFLEDLCPQEHKTSGQKRDVHNLIIVSKPQFIGRISFFLPTRGRDKAPTEQIQWRGEKFA
jgi:hypothetical protein